MKNLLYLSLPFMLIACGSEPTFNAEEYFVQAETTAKDLDAEVGKTLALRSLPGFKQGDNTWDAQVGYVANKPALVKLLGSGGTVGKLYVYLDTATGKPLFMREETRNADGKGVLNRFAYNQDSLVMGITGTNPYSPAGEADFRVKLAEMNAITKAAITAVEADRPDLPKGANEARKENAQFYAFGPNWQMTVNPSIKKVYASFDGPETKIFNYSVPATGPNGETLYNFPALNEKLEVTIVSKYCQAKDGKSYPYTVQVKIGGKTYSGCGVLLQ